MSKKYKHLSVISRQFAYKHKRLGKSNRWIAKQLGVSHTTVGREFRRNEHPCPGLWREMSCYEKAAYAEQKAKARKSKSRVGRGKFSELRLRGYVVGRLRQWWSPDDISRKIKKISAKGIYNFIQRERPDLKAELWQEGAPYRARVGHRRGSLRQGVPTKKQLIARPAEATERTEDGHYELDTVHSIRGVSASVLSILERKHRRSWYLLLSDRTANTVNATLESFFKKLSKAPKTITVDNGPEFAELHKIERQFKLEAYYCEPYKSWQRGSVELANRRLRRGFPKGTDFSNVTQADLDRVERLINNKPMKLLDDKSPAQAFRLYMNG